MKLSTTILLVTFSLLVFGLFATNIALKHEYEKIDKSDLYWTYGSILEQPFKHLKIQGGNYTHIVFEPGKRSSVRVFKNWEGYENKTVQASVKNDTLYINFPEAPTPSEKRYMGYITPVRIFSPELLSVAATNTNFEMIKMKQHEITLRVAGKSKVELESDIHDLAICLLPKPIHQLLCLRCRQNSWVHRQKWYQTQQLQQRIYGSKTIREFQQLRPLQSKAGKQ